MDITNGYGYRTFKNGSVGNNTCYWAYPGETPILDCDAVIPSAGSGTLNNVIRTTPSGVSNVYFKGLVIRNVWQNDGADEVMVWYIFGTNITIDRCIVYNTHGVAFGVMASNNLWVINCDTWNNCDSLTNVPADNPVPGNDGNGFRDYNPSSTGASTYYIHCRAWNCGDQGFSSGSVGSTTYDGCWSFRNGQMKGGGWGFKMGWDQPDDPDKRIYKNNVAVYNRRSGFDTNDGGYVPGYIQLYNNTSFGNSDYGFRILNTNGTTEQEEHRIFKNNIAFQNSDGSIYTASGSAAYAHEYNSWDIPLTLSSADFLSLDSTGITAARQANGSLPDNDCYNKFLKPSSTSLVYQEGVDVGLIYDADSALWRNPPTLGFKEYYEQGVPEDPAVLSDLSTFKPYWQTETTAISGGNVYDDGGGTVTARGVCWNTTGNPTTADSKTTDGTGTGIFYSQMTGLSQDTPYYVRAYATNEAGTAYGNPMTFRTGQALVKDDKILVIDGKIFVIP